MFEVASVREDNSDNGYVDPGFSMDSDNDFKPTGGLFDAVASVKQYIAFAYGLDRLNPMFDGLPQWASQKHFAIRARASADVTKNEMRQMMRALLEQRFHLEMHFEDRTMRVFALQPVTQGKFGKGLRLHTNGPACDVRESKEGSYDRPETILYTQPCNSYSLFVSATTTVASARNTTLSQMAAFLSRTGNLGKPIIDETGIREKVDFYLQYAPEESGPAREDAELSEQPLQDAIKSQLGLKLVSRTASVRVPVVDRVELPTGN